MHPTDFIVVLLLGAGVWRLIRVRRRVMPGAPAVRDDVPARLLGWAAGLLAAERAEWGQAMAGELDQRRLRPASAVPDRHPRRRTPHPGHPDPAALASPPMVARCDPGRQSHQATRSLDRCGRPPSDGGLRHLILHMTAAALGFPDPRRG